MSSTNVSYWIATDLMGKTVMNRRCPFKVHQALWNPFMDLLALASQKGEVCVRRSYWRRGWKRDIYDLKPLLLNRVKLDCEIRLETICWSPDGKVLATAFSDGCIHFLDAEKGIVRYTVRMKTCLKRMRWQQYDANFNIEGVNNDILSGVLCDVSECESVNDKSEEMNQLKAMKTFCEDIALSLLGTLLFVVDENNVLHVLAAGVLPIASIEPPIGSFGNCDPYSITVGDLYFCRERGELMVVYSNMGQLNTTDRPGMNTQLIGFELDSFGCLKNGLVWAVAYRWLQLVFHICFVSEAFARMVVDWDDQSKEFAEKFNSFGEENMPRLSLGDCLIDMILTGQTHADLVNFCRNVLKPAEWKKMTDWVDRGFSELIGNIGKELIPGVEALQHHMKQLIREAHCALHSCKTEKFFPKRLFDVDVYPYGGYANENGDELPLKGLAEFQNLAEDIANKINEMYLVAVRNRKNLNTFTNWLSQTAPFTAKSKRSAGEMKFDLQQIIEYIRQSSETRNETTEEDDDYCYEEKIVTTYTFDRVSQYFDSRKPLKYRLDVRSNSWSCLPQKNSVRSLADCINDCCDALQTIQDIILKNFEATVVLQTTTVLELGHSEGFEKFAIFTLREVGARIPACDAWKWTHTVEKTLFAISCIGVAGSRHLIFGDAGEVLYKMSYTDQSTQSETKSYDSMVQFSPGDIGKSGLFVEEDSAKPFFSKSLSTCSLMNIEKSSNIPVRRRLLHFEWYGNGIFYGLLKLYKADKEETALFRSNILERKNYVHEDTSGCMESYCLFTVSCQRNLGVAFTDNGFRIKWFEIHISEQSGLFSTEKQSKTDAYEVEKLPTQSDEVKGIFIDEVKQMHAEESMDVDYYGKDTPSGGVQLRRSMRKRKPLKK